MLKTGDTAPDFTLPDQDGNPVTLSSVLAEARRCCSSIPRR